MHAAWGATLILAGFLPTAANAGCEPSFGSGSSLVALTPAPSFDDQEIAERFEIEVRNAGSDLCTLRLSVGRDIPSSDQNFPAYTLSSSSGAISAPLLAGSEDAAGSPAGVTITVPANGRVLIPYDVRLNVGWGVEARTYQQELVYRLHPSDSRDELATQRTRLSLTIPTAARIRFSGASATNGAPVVDMGPLSPISRTRSPPFAIRVLSTAPYRIELASENGGKLRRIDGPDLIPYRLSVNNQHVDLGGGGSLIRVPSHTGSTGNVHPVTIEIEPDPTRHAGNYSDRVTVTVSTF
jgi:spore coat protein U-like protein